MAAVIRVALLPFVLAWSLLRLLIGPAIVLGLAWLFFGFASLGFVVTCVGLALYLGVVITAWRAGVRGALRSLARGPVEITGRRGRRAGRGRKSR